MRPVAGSQVEAHTAVSSTGDGPAPTQLGSSTILQDLLRKGPEEQGIYAGKLVGLALLTVPAFGEGGKGGWTKWVTVAVLYAPFLFSTNLTIKGWLHVSAL